MLTLPGAALVGALGAGFGGGGTGVGATVLISVGAGGGTSLIATFLGWGAAALTGAGVALVSFFGADFGAALGVFADGAGCLEAAFTGTRGFLLVFFAADFAVVDFLLSTAFLTRAFGAGFFFEVGFETAFLGACLEVAAFFDFALDDLVLLTFQLLLF